MGVNSYVEHAHFSTFAKTGPGEKRGNSIE